MMYTIKVANQIMELFTMYVSFHLHKLKTRFYLHSGKTKDWKYGSTKVSCIKQKWQALT